MCLRALCASDVGFAEGISQREGERLRRVSTPITYNLLPLTSNLSPHRLIANIPSRLQVHRTVHHPAAPLLLFLSVQLSEDKSSQGCILGLFFKEFFEAGKLCFILHGCFDFCSRLAECFLHCQLVG